MINFFKKCINYMKKGEPAPRILEVGVYGLCALQLIKGGRACLVLPLDYADPFLNCREGDSGCS